MKRNNIPTPNYYVAKNEKEAIRFINKGLFKLIEMIVGLGA